MRASTSPSAVYEWNYSRQMIEIRLAEAAGGADRDKLRGDIFDERFLIKRPLLQALEPDKAGPPVLLIDELDRTDEPFEAYLLEVLSDYQITVPEIGTFKAAEAPIVIITSNRTREIHDALKRRCFYYWVDYPDAARELEILKVKVPGADVELSKQIVAFVQRLRTMDLFKLPGVAETIDWTQALTQLDVISLDPQSINSTRSARCSSTRTTSSASRAPRPPRSSTRSRARWGRRRSPGSGTRASRWSTRSPATACRRPRAADAWPRTSCISAACCARPACRSARARCSTRSPPSAPSASPTATISTGRSTRCSSTGATSASCSTRPSTSSGATRSSSNA